MPTDQYSLLSFLYPPALPPTPYLIWPSDLRYNKSALDGWVKQHSPACAAASVAGAWNTLLNRHREHEEVKGMR